MNIENKSSKSILGANTTYPRIILICQLALRLKKEEIMDYYCVDIFHKSISL